MIYKFFFGLFLLLFVPGAGFAQYMGCPETLTGICPPGTLIQDTACTSQKSASSGVKSQSVNESTLDTTQTWDKQDLLAGGQDDLTTAKVGKVESPTPTGEMSSVKEERSALF